MFEILWVMCRWNGLKSMTISDMTCSVGKLLNRKLETSLTSFSKKMIIQITGLCNFLFLVTIFVSIYSKFSLKVILLQVGPVRLVAFATWFRCDCKYQANLCHCSILHIQYMKLPWDLKVELPMSHTVISEATFQSKIGSFIIQF